MGVPVVVTESWNLNFSDRSRTLITRLDESNTDLARKIAIFLNEVRNLLKFSVLSRGQVVEAYVRKLYGLEQ